MRRSLRLGTDVFSEHICYHVLAEFVQCPTLEVSAPIVEATRPVGLIGGNFVVESDPFFVKRDVGQTPQVIASDALNNTDHGLPHHNALQGRRMARYG